jgi:prepilin-type processing-associated H-X9-DG protein
MQLCESTGVFYGNSQVKISRITDGTGKTFMIGERDRFCMAGTWLGGRNAANGSENHSTLWTLGHVFDPLNNPHTLNYDTCTEGFASPHPGGGYFAFCDASVHFITDDIDSNNLQQSRKCNAKATAPAPVCQTSTTLPSGTVKIGVYQRLGWKDDAEPVDNIGL